MLSAASALTINIIWANSADDTVKTICMKCQTCFLGKIREQYFNKLPAENFTQSAKH